MNDMALAAATYLYFLGLFLTLQWPGLEDRVTTGERWLAALFWPFAGTVFLCSGTWRRP